MNKRRLSNLLLSLFSCKDMSNSLQPHGLQGPLSMGFSRQEYWSGLPFPSPGEIPNPRIEPTSPAWQEDSLPPSYEGRTGDQIPSVQIQITFKLILKLSSSEAK